MCPLRPGIVLKVFSQNSHFSDSWTMTLFFNSFSPVNAFFINGLIIFSAMILTYFISLFLLLVTVIEFSFLLFGPYSLITPYSQCSLPFFVFSSICKSTSCSIPLSLESKILNLDPLISPFTPF